MAYKYPSLRTTLPVAGYYARLDAGAAATDQFTTDGTQNGTLTNGATRTDDGGLAYSFTAGASQFIAIGSGFFAAYPVAMSCWFKTSDTTAAFRTLFSLGNSANVTNHMFLGLTNTHKLRWNPSRDPTNAVCDSAASVNDGNWHHACGVSESVASHKLYLDGALVATSTQNMGGVVSCNQAGIGCLRRQTNASFYTGVVDDALIYLIDPGLTNIGYMASQRGAIYEPAVSQRRRTAQASIRSTF
jgi:hypothetical protein